MKMSIMSLIIAFWNVFCQCITPLWTNLSNSQGILGFVHNIFALINPSNYQAVLDWALVEVPVTSTMYAPQGLIVLMLFLAVDRLFLTPAMNEILRIFFRIRRALPIAQSYVRTAFNDGVAAVQLATEELIRRVKLLPSIVSAQAKKVYADVKKDWQDAKEDAIAFGRFVVSIVKACYTFMKFVWRLLKTLAVCVKMGMHNFSEQYEKYQNQEAATAKAKAARKAKRAQEKTQKAFRHKYGIPSQNRGIVVNAKFDDNRKVG